MTQKTLQTFLTHLRQGRVRMLVKELTHPQMRHFQIPINQRQISTDQSETAVLQLISTRTSK